LGGETRPEKKTRSQKSETESPISVQVQGRMDGGGVFLRRQQGGLNAARRIRCPASALKKNKENLAAIARDQTGKKKKKTLLT